MSNLYLLKTVLRMKILLVKAQTAFFKIKIAYLKWDNERLAIYALLIYRFLP